MSKVSEQERADAINNGGEPIKFRDASFDTGAVRSADVDDFDFASAPLAGLLGVLRVGGGGGIKYGRHNYSKGIPVHVTLNHVAVHLIRYLLGDRTEDHLSKVAWGAMVANQTAVMQPDLSDPYLLGPGATVTAAMNAEMDKHKAERDAARESGAFERLFDWTLGDIPEIKALLNKRQAMRAVAELKAAILAGSAEVMVFEPALVKVKRKRRTKAEIAADKELESMKVYAEANSSAAKTTSSSTLTDQGREFLEAIDAQYFDENEGVVI